MKHFSTVCHWALLLATALAGPFTASAQTAGVGIGTTTPTSRLEVNGGLTLTETTSPGLTGASPAYTIPANVSQVRLVAGATAPTGTLALTSITPVSGQILTVYNGTAIPATLNGQTVPAGNAVTFVYSNNSWRTTSATGPAGATGATGPTGPAGSNATVAAGPGLSSTVSGGTTTVALGGSALNGATDVPLGSNTLTFSSATGGRVGVGNLSTVPFTLSVTHENGTPTATGATNGLGLSHVLGPTWTMYVSNSNAALQFYRNGIKEVEFAADGAVNLISDSTAKTQVQRVEDGQITRLMRLQPKSYLYKHQVGTRRQYGLMAQELAVEYPNLAQHGVDDDGKEYWTVNYIGLVPVLVKAIQEQQQQLEALRARNTALQTSSAVDHAALVTLQAQMARLLGNSAQPRK